jgi:hypothetical protein
MLLFVIIMFYNDLWGFFIDPPYFGYNSAEQENPVLCILRFRDLLGLKLTWDFRALIFYHGKHLEEKKSMRRGPWAKRTQMARAPCQAADVW